MTQITSNLDRKSHASIVEQYGGDSEVDVGILFSKDDYWVSNEGSREKPNYHVWMPNLTHSIIDSAYADFSLACCRCAYLAKCKMNTPRRM